MVQNWKQKWSSHLHQVQFSENVCKYKEPAIKSREGRDSCQNGIIRGCLEGPLPAFWAAAGALCTLRSQDRVAATSGRLCCS